MGELEFKQLFLCDFYPSEGDVRLQNLAEYYHEVTEAYDAKVCSGKSKYDGCAIPLNNWELKMININSREVMKLILRDNPDIEPRLLRKAISEVNNGNGFI